MAFDSLGEFVRTLRRAGELVDVRARVSAKLEISEITDRVVKVGGPALLFHDVEGSAFPVLTNQFGTEKRMALSFGARSLAEVEQRVRNAVDLGKPKTIAEGFTKAASLGSIANSLPRTISGPAPCQDVVDLDPDLTKLPVLTTWPLDGGPFITLPLVFTMHPETKQQNVGMYRVQVYDAKTTGMHWQKHKQGRAHAVKWGRKIPVAIVVGADPAITYSATAPLPPVLDEMVFAGFMRGRPVRMVKCKTIDVKVPADAEFVLEGYVDNDDLRVEGPFGDHTGVYSLADYYPTFHCTALTHRNGAIWGATVVGKPPMEDAWIGKATERIFLPLLQMVVPEIVDYNLPVEGGFHNLCIVAVKKTYPGQAKKVMNALWGLGHMMMLTRYLIIVDGDVDPHDIRAVAWFVLNNTDPARDLVVMPGPVDDLDHSGSYLVSVGHKLGIDATRKRADEGYARAWPPDIVSDQATRDRVDARWREYGLHGIRTKPDSWSGQGEVALAQLLARLPLQPGAVDNMILRANGVPALAPLGGHDERSEASRLELGLDER